MVRNNCFLIYTTHYGDNGMSHKQFTLKIIDELMAESEFYYKNDSLNMPSTQAVDRVPPTPPHTSTTRPILQQSPSLSQASSISSLSNVSSYLSKTSRTNKSKTKATPTKALSEASTTIPPPAKKYKVTKAKSISDFPARLRGLKTEHVRVKSNLKGISGKKERLAKACVYCSLELHRKRKENEDRAKLHRRSNRDEEASLKSWDKQVKRTEYFCSFCKVFLCKEHFIPFHEEE